MAEVQESVKKALHKYGIGHTVLECDPTAADTAAFCEAYGIKPEQCANTILVASRKIDPTQYAVCVVLATDRLDVNKAVCKTMGVKRASFATAEQTIEQTGMMIGGVVAIGIEDLPIFIDSQVMEQAEVVMGGGNRSSKLKLNPQELLKLPSTKVVEALARQLNN